MVFVEGSRERRRKTLLGEAQHLDDHEAARRVRADFVADGYRVARFDARTVYFDVTPGTRVARERARLEEPRGREPLIDTDGGHDQPGRYTSPMSASARRRRRFLDVDRPLLFAHRGGAKLWPENTLYAFQNALELGLTFWETDLHETRDGTLVLHHDERVDRTTNGSGRIRDLRYAELSNLDAGYRFTDESGGHPYRGKGIKIPTLAEVFDLSPISRLNVEIKPPGRSTARKLWQFIEHRGLHDRILVAGERHRNIRRFRRYSAERVATSASGREVLRFWMAVRARMDRFLPVEFDALQVPPTHRGLTIVDRPFIRAAHRHGVQVHVWTLDEPSEIRRLLNLGVDGVISDRPDRLVNLGTRTTTESLRPMPL
jgi:glycerophosphoryl diester phosphodiesterase